MAIHREARSAGLSFDELALRFAAHAPGVSACIAGTSSLAHLLRDIALVDKGPLSSAVFAALRDAFRRCDRDWLGQI